MVDELWRQHLRALQLRACQTIGHPEYRRGCYSCSIQICPEQSPPTLQFDLSQHRIRPNGLERFPISH